MKNLTALRYLLILVFAFAAASAVFGGGTKEPTVTPAESTVPSRYMGAPVELATADNGATVNAALIEAYPLNWYDEKTVVEVTDGVWVVGGYSIANTIVIEGDDGLILYDVGDTKEEAEHIRDAIREQISEKPVKVIMYSHSHYALGGGVFVENPDDVLVIGHPKLNETVQNNLSGGGAPSAIPEIGPLLSARALVQFSNYMPTEGPDASLQAKLQLGQPIAFLPVTRTVENGETMNLLGHEIQFFTEGLSDDHNLTVWLPEQGVVLNNFVFPGRPNIYSLRGVVYRDPLIWRDALKMIRNLQPEIVLNTHAPAIIGKEQVLQVLTGYMDHLTLTYDQTLRGILKGLGPDDLREFLYFPAHLNDMPENTEIYGESVHFSEAIFNYAIGWFDWDVTQIFKVAPREEAGRLVQLMGGRDRVLDQARQALDNEEFAWGTQLVQYVYLLDQSDQEVRQLKADLLRQMGYRAMGSIPRAFLISEALALEGKVEIPRLIPPQPALISDRPDVFVDYFRVRIDPRKSENSDLVLQFVFTDKGDNAVSLHVRRGIAEFISVPDDYYRDADSVMEMDSETWSNLYLSTISLKEAMDSGKVILTSGDANSTIEVFELFDAYQPTKNYMVPPYNH